MIIKEKKEISSAAKVSSQATQLPQIIKKEQMFETLVYGSSETGLTIVNERGRGTFFPDQTKIPEITTKDFNLNNNQFDKNDNSTTPLEVLYPQWKDGVAETAIAIYLVKKSLLELQTGAENPCNSTAELLNYLAIAETLLFQALEKSKFNKAFELVVSFCAWAVRNTSLNGDFPSLQGLCVALREIQDNPFIKIDRATKIIIDLEKQGWSDESPLSTAFNSGLI